MHNTVCTQDIYYINVHKFMHYRLYSIIKPVDENREMKMATRYIRVFKNF